MGSIWGSRQAKHMSIQLLEIAGPPTKPSNYTSADLKWACLQVSPSSSRLFLRFF